MTDRYYVVTPKAEGGKRRIVKASHPANALRHVASDTLVVAVASQDDLVKLLGEGVQVETIKAEQRELPT